MLQKSRLQSFSLQMATRRTRRGWTSKEAVAKRTPTCPVRAAWVRALRRRADNDSASHLSPLSPRLRLTRLCTAATLCIDCQKHDVYATQFRAMFVRNCLVSRTERLREGGGESGAVFYSVRCADCLTEVAVRDEEEVYHFFNVLATVRVRNCHTGQLCAHRTLRPPHAYARLSLRLADDFAKDVDIIFTARRAPESPRAAPWTAARS